MLNRVAELVRRKQPLPQLASNDLQECHEWAVMAELAIQLLARTGQLLLGGAIWPRTNFKLKSIAACNKRELWKSNLVHCFLISSQAAKSVALMRTNNMQSFGRLTFGVYGLLQITFDPNHGILGAWPFRYWFT